MHFYITGRIDPRARSEVSTWTHGNATLRTYRYSRLRRLLIFGTDHPFTFATSVGLLAATTAYLLAIQEWTAPWVIPAPVLKKDFDASAFFGVPWSIQATLVALVYPIVVSFIALMLQRKAHSTVSLRVYILDSAVIPAGTSSVGLLIAIGVQYFVTPYGSDEFPADLIPPLLVMNGVWLLINLLLTGFFLSRTMRFIQEDEQRHAFTRVAVDIALREELVASVKKHIFLGAPQVDWGYPDLKSEDGSVPLVRTFSYSSGITAVKRDIKGSVVLYDVYLRLLQLVATLWRRRAIRSSAIREGQTPKLIFPPVVGGEPSREVVLCSIENGPPLYWYERFIVKIAFRYRAVRTGSLSLSTRKMLEEIGKEVEAAAEQKRFGAAEDRLRDLLLLHRALLLACVADADAIEGNAATIGISPYSLGSSSFDLEWLKPYRDIGRIAVSCLEDDPRLFRAMSVVPTQIAYRLQPRPEKLLTNAQLIGTHLAFQLASWWTRKADANMSTSTSMSSGILPTPLNKVYEQAIVDFIGSWGQFRVEVPNYLKGDEIETWQAHTGRALVYVTHIENSANLFLKAVSRGDETGSVWLLENFLKWWGNREHELRCAEIEGDFRVRNITLTLASASWDDAKDLLWDGERPVTFEFAVNALNLATRRYWESMRLYLILLLIQNAGEAPQANSRELRLAAVLIAAKAQQAGGRVEAQSLSTLDDVLTRLLGIVFGAESTSGRLDTFAHSLSWNNEVQEVPGWIYSWWGSPTELSSMSQSLAVLLVSIASGRTSSLTRSKRCIESFWRDVDKLKQVNDYLAEIRQNILYGSFGKFDGVVNILKAHLGVSYPPRNSRLAATVMLKKLRKVASHERLISLRASNVDPEKVGALVEQITASALNKSNLPAPIRDFRYLQRMEQLTPMSYRFTDVRSRYLSTINSSKDIGSAESIGNSVQRHMVAWSLATWLVDGDIQPVNSPDLRNMYDATDSVIQSYFFSVVERCAELKAKGLDPVVLVGSTTVGHLLSAHRWGIEPWKRVPPQGIDINSGNEIHPKAKSSINGIPVFEFNTPNNDCYVVPRIAIEALDVNALGPTNALSIEYEQKNEEVLIFTVKWRAGFQSK